MFDVLSSQLAFANEKRMLDDVQHVPQLGHPPKPAKPKLARLTFDEEDHHTRYIAVSARATGSATASAYPTSAAAAAEAKPLRTSTTERVNGATTTTLAPSTDIHDDDGVQALVYHVHDTHNLPVACSIMTIVICVVAFVMLKHLFYTSTTTMRSSIYQGAAAMPLRNTQPRTAPSRGGSHHTIDRMLRYA